MNIGFEKPNVWFDGGENPFEPARVIIEPLENNYGTTMGVALRRVMLDTIPGASVIGIRIHGVNHEFALIEGSATDCAELIMNLKKLRFSVEGDEMATIRFSKKEEGWYTAADLELPEGVQIQNPDQRLINLTGERPLEMEVYVKNGRGFVDKKEHKEFHGPEGAGVVAIDGKFSPIDRAGWSVEKLRIGQDASYERLVLDVVTDGSLHAKDAAATAGKFLEELFKCFKGMSLLAEKTDVFQEKQQEEEDRVLSQTIEELDLSVRSYNCLKREGFMTVRHVINLTIDDLFNINQLGERSIKEIVEKVESLGLSLKKKE